VFYENGYEGSADYILQYDGIGQQEFLKHIIQEGIARYERKKKNYVLKIMPLQVMVFMLLKIYKPANSYLRGKKWRKELLLKMGR